MKIKYICNNSIRISEELLFALIKVQILIVSRKITVIIINFIYVNIKSLFSKVIFPFNKKFTDINLLNSSIQFKHILHAIINYILFLLDPTFYNSGFNFLKILLFN